METKKMTLAEAQELVKNTKYIVWNEAESSRLQIKLFEIGCEWLNAGQEVQYTKYPFLFVNKYLKLTFAHKEASSCFDDAKKACMLADDIICIEIKKEHKHKFDPKTLKPFDKVLVKNDGEIWNIDFYNRYNSEAETYFCIGGVYSYCIPYNEETKYLHGNGNKEPEFYQQD